MTTPSLATVFATSPKVSLTKATFLVYILPPFACQYLMGVLVQLEGTRFYRLALLPILMWFACRGMFVDMAGGDIKQADLNMALIMQMCTILTRCSVWAVAEERFHRQSPSKKENDAPSENIYTVLWNSWDLLFNRRGIGWNWSRGLTLPKSTFETDSRIVFVFLSATRLAIHAFFFDACIQTLRMMSPETFSSLEGGSLFDHTLPPFLEFLRAVAASFLAAGIVYCALQWNYQFLAIVCTILLQQHPSQWPPIFDSPWMSTSLSELWGRRWHQMMREQFLALGVQPFGYLFGRLGGLFGAFLVSGILHDIELRSFGRGGNSVAIIGFWMIHCVGVVLECVWKSAMGRRVGGVWGWMWTFGWFVFWGILMTDAWAKAGRFGATGLPGGFEPSLVLAKIVQRCFVAP